MSAWIPSKQFHTLSIKAYSITKIVPEEMTLRNLLISYFQISSMKYRTEEDICRITEELYDFNFVVRGDITGCYHMISFQGNAIHPEFIKDEAYTLERIFTCFQDLSTPYVHEDGLDLKTFKKAKRLLKASLEKNTKYPEYQATRGAIGTYFKGTIRAFDAKGNVKDLEKITIEELYQYYLKFQKEEKISIGLGDVDAPLELIDSYELHSEINFKDRISMEPYMNVKARTKQCYLRVIYDTQVFTGDTKLYPLSILNYALGGSTYSHLFRIVREKYGLCYSIDSDCYGASGIVLISAEIQKKDVNKALVAIEEAIDTLLDVIDLEKIKRLFTITHEARYDNPGAYITDELRRKVFPQAYDADTYIEANQRVTMEDLKQTRELLKKPSFIYVYGGLENE